MKSQFPDPVLPPESVGNERASRQSRLLKATCWGALIRCTVIAAELLGFIWFNSAALFLDAMASIMDLVATIALAICIRLAGRPPDQNHPFGHGRYEPLAGLQLGLLLVLVGTVLFLQQSSELYTLPKQDMDPRAWMIPFMAVLLLEVSYHQAKRVAKHSNSPALMAEAWHYRIDALNSLIATTALAIAAIFPEWGHAMDHLGAVVIAGLIIVIGLRASKANLHQLMDHIPGEQFFSLVRRAANAIKGVKGTEKIRIQLYGPDAHVDIDVEVDPTLSVDEAHRISQCVRAGIQKEWPAVRDVTVHIEPFYENDH